MHQEAKYTANQNSELKRNKKKVWKNKKKHSIANLDRTAGGNPPPLKNNTLNKIKRINEKQNSKNY